MSKSFFMIVCVLAVVLKGYNNSHTAVTQGYSHPCNCSAQRALVGTATRLIRDERYRRVAVVLAPHDSRLILSSESQNRISP